MITGHIAVIGAGTMGHGIARLCLDAGYEVHIVDTDPTVAQAVATSLAPHAERTGAQIIVAQPVDAMTTAGVVIDATPQHTESKREVLSLALSTCKADTIIGTVTLGVPLEQLALDGHGSTRVLGLHFMNPPHRLKYCEVVTGELIDLVPLDAAIAFLTSLGVSYSIVKDTPGFVLNALLLPFLFDAVRALEAGLASANDIDLAFTAGCAHPMGPLRVLDLVGLQVAVTLGDEMIRNGCDSGRFAPPELLRRLATKGGLLRP